MNLLLEVFADVATKRGLQAIKNDDGTVTLKEKEERHV